MKAAAVQFEPRLASKEENLRRCLEYIKEASENGASLVVFPECALTGYVFNNIEEATAQAESIPGRSEGMIAEACKRLKIHAIVGVAELDKGRIFNTAIFCGAEGFIGRYRKVHLPYLGLDRFAKPGDEPFRVYSTGVGRIGINICYDSLFPEAARVLALDGAELIALPTNWARGVEFYVDYLIQARAIENRVNYIAVNRVGEEGGFTFYGKSKIVDYSGRILAEAGEEREEIIYAEIDLSATRVKKVVRIPRVWEVDFFADRRPEFYLPIVEKARSLNGA